MLTSKVLADDILLMKSALIHVIKNSQDPDFFNKTQQMKTKSYIAFSVNDAPAEDKVGGSHWKWICYCLKGHRIYIF